VLSDSGSRALLSLSLVGEREKTIRGTKKI